MESIEPVIDIDNFIYSCSNKFITEHVNNYMKTLDGSIIFANGNECIIYEWKTKFIKKKFINANLIKKHKKGGQSSVRFSRLAEESRVQYVALIIDNLNQIKTKNNWLFGSNEILDMIFNKKDNIYVKIQNGGFYNFDNTSINNQAYWLKYLEDNKNYNKYYEKILYYLDTNPDMLDFDINNKNDMEFFMINKDCKKIDNNQIPFIQKDNKYYDKLYKFEYIGIKYYNYNFDLSIE